MNKDQKQAAVKEIGERLQESKPVFAVDYRGISVPEAAELRTRFRETDASFLQRLVDHGQDAFEVRAGSNLGHDTAEFFVQFFLSRDALA